MQAVYIILSEAETWTLKTDELELQVLKILNHVICRNPVKFGCSNPKIKILTSDKQKEATILNVKLTSCKSWKAVRIHSFIAKCTDLPKTNHFEKKS